jgi:hypothetical protein
MCVDTTWEDQLGYFAQIVSANLIATYEGWAEELMPKFGARQFINEVQFPSQGWHGRRSRGVNEAINDARSHGISSDMKNAFYPVYTASRKYNLGNLDALLAIYRYHKEIRNSLMHRGGIADLKAQNAWTEAATLTRADTGLRTSPALTRVIDGVPVKTNISEAIQLSDSLLRIVCTIDAELCFTEVAEEIFVSRWRQSEPARRSTFLPADRKLRDKRLGGICRSLGYVSPDDPEAVYQMGRRAALVL